MGVEGTRGGMPRRVLRWKLKEQIAGGSQMCLLYTLTGNIFDMNISIWLWSQVRVSRLMIRRVLQSCLALEVEGKRTVLCLWCRERKKTIPSFLSLRLGLTEGTRHPIPICNLIASNSREPHWDSLPKGHEPIPANLYCWEYSCWSQSFISGFEYLCQHKHAQTLNS